MFKATPHETIPGKFCVYFKGSYLGAYVANSPKHAEELAREDLKMMAGK